MKLWNSAYNWLREYKPKATLKRINGSSEILTVIIKEGKKFTLIEFTFVDTILVPVEEEYNLCEDV